MSQSRHFWIDEWTYTHLRLLAMLRSARSQTELHMKEGVLNARIKTLRTGVEKCLKVGRIIRDAAPGKILGALNRGPFGLAPRQHMS